MDGKPNFEPVAAFIEAAVIRDDHQVFADLILGEPAGVVAGVADVVSVDEAGRLGWGRQRRQLAFGLTPTWPAFFLHQLMEGVDDPLTLLACYLGQLVDGDRL